MRARSAKAPRMLYGIQSGAPNAEGRCFEGNPQWEDLDFLDFLGFITGVKQYSESPLYRDSFFTAVKTVLRITS